MYISRILYPITVLGPGKRVGIWFCGCPRRCVGCSNPELWEFREKYKTSLSTVIDIIRQISNDNIIDGFTITGGEPFYQSTSLSKLLEEIKVISDDIIVYTGYCKDELSVELLNNVAVLIDGSYLEEYNNNSFMRGSSNQKIYILNNKYQSLYDTYINNNSNQIQNFMIGNSCISVGIHKKKFIL